MKVHDVMFALKSRCESLFPTIRHGRSFFSTIPSHIGLCMLRTIFSLFKRCGLVQLRSSAGFGGLGNVKKALTVGDVKEGINFYKKLHEALLRTKIKYIDVSIGDERNVVHVSQANKKEKNIIIDMLRQGVSKETFENVISQW